MSSVQPCMCGGFIAVPDGDVAAAVSLHNRTMRHMVWRGFRYQQCAGVEGTTCIVTIPLDRRLCHYCRGTLRLLAQRAAAA